MFTGNAWQRSRKILTKAFHFNILKKFFNTFVEQTAILNKELRKDADKKQIELLPVISDLTLHIMCGEYCSDDLF